MNKMINLLYPTRYLTQCNICFACLLFFSAITNAAEEPGGVLIDGGGQVAPVQPDKTKGDDEKKPDDDGDEALFRSASLESDPETETLLQRSREFIATRQFDTAVRLLQKVIDGSDAILVKSANGVYIPARRRAEDLIAALPKEGLELYRVAADAEAEALLSPAESQLINGALTKTTKRFF